MQSALQASFLSQTVLEWRRALPVLMAAQQRVEMQTVAPAPPASLASPVLVRILASSVSGRSLQTGQTLHAPVAGRCLVFQGAPSAGSPAEVERQTLSVCFLILPSYSL